MIDVAPRFTWSSYRGTRRTVGFITYDGLGGSAAVANGCGRRADPPVQGAHEADTAPFGGTRPACTPRSRRHNRRTSNSGSQRSTRSIRTTGRAGRRCWAACPPRSHGSTTGSNRSRPHRPARGRTRTPHRPARGRTRHGPTDPSIGGTRPMRTIRPTTPTRSIRSTGNPPGWFVAPAHPIRSPATPEVPHDA